MLKTPDASRPDHPAKEPRDSGVSAPTRFAQCRFRRRPHIYSARYPLIGAGEREISFGESSKFFCPLKARDLSGYLQSVFGKLSIIAAAAALHNTVSPVCFLSATNPASRLGSPNSRSIFFEGSKAACRITAERLQRRLMPGSMDWRGRF